jgi:hypothetical protein
MTFFYDLNKRLAALADKQDSQQLAEDTKAQAPRSKLAESMGVAEADYSAKKAAAGKDIGKPGKNFGKIAKGAAERYGSKAAGERVAGAVLNKLRHAKEDITDEGNAFTAALKATPKGGKFKVGGKEFTDNSDLEEGSMKHMMHKDAERMSREKFCAKYGDEYGEFWDNIMGDLDEGFKEMDAWVASREKEKGTGKFDKRITSTGTVYTRKPETFDDPETDSETTDGAPKRRGRPKGKDKGPERVTAKSYKYKAGRPTKTKEDLDVDGVMMTRPSNMSSEGVDPGEYEQEGDMAKGTVHTIVRNARELEKHLRNDDNLPTWVIEKLGQIKGMMTSVSDYMISQKERGIGEVAPPGAKAERMVKGIKKSLSKDGHLSGKDKAIAYATTWKAKKAGKVEEEGLEKQSTSALKAASSKSRTADQKSEVPANFSTAQLKAELAKRTKGKVEETGKKEPMKKDAKDKKEEKVDETTVSGSVATATTSGKSSSGGMQFGKGVYEGFNTQVESMITEGMNVSVNMSTDANGKASKNITVSAEGDDADQLAALLKMAGLHGQSSESCGTCGASPCGCEQTVDEAYGDTDETLNDPDWPTDTETLAADPNLRTYSGGLNGPKSTGQTTIPVVASQERRLHSMDETVELERNLFKTWKNYKG